MSCNGAASISGCKARGPAAGQHLSETQFTAPFWVCISNLSCIDSPITCKPNTDQLECLHVPELPAPHLWSITRENTDWNTKAEGLTVTTAPLLASLNTVIQVFWTVACSYWILFCLKIDTSLLPPSATSFLVTLRFWWFSPVSLAAFSQRSPSGCWVFDPSAASVFCKAQSQKDTKRSGQGLKKEISSIFAFTFLI